MTSDLSFEEKIGQHFIIGVNDNNTDFIVDLIKDYHIGGVILYKKNYRTYSEMIDVINKFKEANKDNKIPLFIAIDQEFGKVNRMPIDIANLRNVYDVSAYDDRLLYDYANIITVLLKDSGINMNLAPVLDIYDDLLPKTLYKRCFAGSGDSISKYGKIFVDTFKKNEIISVAKHFPGHGSSKYDSHLTVPFIKEDKEVLNKHIQPFYNLFNDLDALMVGHLKIDKLTEGDPASLSNEFIEKYIRDKGYNNLIITDEITMLKRNILWFIYKKKLLRSKSDILLLKVNNKKEAISYINGFKKKVNEKDLDIMVQRIITIKEKYNINDRLKISKINIDKINEIIDSINEKVFYID